MIDGSEKRNLQLAFELQNSHVCEKHSKNFSFNQYHNKEFCVFSQQSYYIKAIENFFPVFA